MSSANSIAGVSAGTKKQAKRYSPVFLAVFAVFLVATLICVGGTLVGVLSAVPSHHDTICFWTSGHLLVHGGNPYDSRAISDLQARLGFPVNRSQVFMTREPPPALFLMLPLGLFAPWAAMMAWSLMLAVLFALAVMTIRQMLPATLERGYLLLAFCFAPALCCIEVGQTGLITLVGLAFFLRFRETMPLWSGVALSLCGVKPHLFLPFGLVLLAWVIAKKKWAIVAGAALAIAAESLIAMLFDHSVWSHYSAALHGQQILGEFIPTLGVGLRFMVRRSALWLEFVPAALGCAWAGWYFWRNRERWDWRTHGSMVTLISLVVAPYAWFTDQVLALPAILFALTSANGPRRGSVTLLMAAMTLAAADMVASKSLYFKPNMLWGVVWVGWYLYATSRSPVKTSSPEEENKIGRAD